MSTVQREVAVGAPASEVWRVLTTRDLVREWSAVIVDEMDVNTGWRNGGKVAWKAPGGYARSGKITAFEANHRLGFEYPARPDQTQSELFEISGDGTGSRLTLTIVPGLDQDERALHALAGEILAAIASLAEELAHIRGLRR